MGSYLLMWARTFRHKKVSVRWCLAIRKVAQLKELGRDEVHEINGPFH